MNVLFRQATIIAPSSPHHLQVRDILVADGFIKSIGTDIISENAAVVESPNLHVSTGWCDLFADFAEPGYEYRETLESGAAAASAGGYTDVIIIPDTLPPVSSRSQIEFFKQRAASYPVSIHATGTISKNAEGKELAEMYDMHEGGAIAFTDGRKTIQSGGLLLKALQYAEAKDAVLIQLPDDQSISSGGLMHEGIMSTRLGLPGAPALAEELMIDRDLSILKYTNSKLHITGVSTKKGLASIKAAKAEGLKVTCSVTPAHLRFCDEDLEQYDTNLKLYPPLRTREDMMSLREALNNGDIDCIAGHHSPQQADDKICEFEYAKPGMLSLQTTFAVVNEFSSDITQTISLLSDKVRDIFNIKQTSFAEGAEASLTFFDPEAKYIFDHDMILSKSKNSPFVGKEVKGKVIGIYNKKQLILNS